jgi:predicted house-cleaning noncanonical NTP pyrophosphatase (MazG superfamily)
MIWQEEKYQANLQAKLENDAREWLKKKLDESKGIVRCETIVY